ncbi:aminoglycoside phosphotransferase family protein [Aidingimonas halophila]|uniref:Aminoglycoside phosphotransferase domain-containing protein n=1 Tax=Aidingimonas halophila TaxID=574349 RepID=A0A1H2UI65_9GAMM|nr:phosphotransferase [Aidingimonas halophila]GHC22604.1 cell wall phosphotransferase [Aidingimonas halophila]SDW55239.1 hypothetical protein SAMN05443545_102142 [Aidingimonas halophila]
MSSDSALSRHDQLRHWLAEHHGLMPDSLDLRLAADDASFRRYFRLVLPGGDSRIIMDAPPDKEDSRPFVSIGDSWYDSGLPVPHMHHRDLEQGFIELDDLGDTPMHHHLGSESAPATLSWHDRALALLDQLQVRAPADALPAYDATLLGTELDLFKDWCLGALLETDVPSSWPFLRQRLIDLALEQPCTAVHRDYDAMNLMVHDDQLFMIDFQDAVKGPISYDLVSLLRGRYCRFSAEQYTSWISGFHQRALTDGRLPDGNAFDHFRFQADAMAAQRSLKVLGIFCRLALRDHKTRFLARLPHFLGHLEDSLTPWPAFTEFRTWLDAHFKPRLHAELQRQPLTGSASS